MTSGTADILIADTSAEMMLKVQFSEENKEHVIVGANVELISDVLMETEKNAVGKLKITAIQQNTESTKYASDWHLSRCANRDKQKNVFRVYTFRSAASRRGKSILCVYHR